ncbi:MAG: hypothetical protein ILNGONEN_00306 [Syntrophorhabdaceae bacterium]|nr:hypothetical protein [Syntrophorhabdaceae bacterium]
MPLVFELEFIDPRKSDHPMNPTAKIYLKKYSSNESGRIFITPVLASPNEVDYYIDSLISDLDKIRKIAKRKFKQD